MGVNYTKEICYSYSQAGLTNLAFTNGHVKLGIDGEVLRLRKSKLEAGTFIAQREGKVRAIRRDIPVKLVELTGKKTRLKGLILPAMVNGGPVHSRSPVFHFVLERNGQKYLGRSTGYNDGVLEISVSGYRGETPEVNPEFRVELPKDAEKGYISEK